jgi:hypothetical protein
MALRVKDIRYEPRGDQFVVTVDGLYDDFDAVDHGIWFKGEAIKTRMELYECDAREALNTLVRERYFAARKLKPQGNSHLADLNGGMHPDVERISMAVEAEQNRKRLLSG